MLFICDATYLHSGSNKYLTHVTTYNAYILLLFYKEIEYRTIFKKDILGQFSNDVRLSLLVVIYCFIQLAYMVSVPPLSMYKRTSKWKLCIYLDHLLLFRIFFGLGWRSNQRGMQQPQRFWGWRIEAENISWCQMNATTAAKARCHKH